jgi:hypothetical protein
MRARLLLVTACVAVAGCGGGDDPPAQRALAPVVLEVTEPADEAVVRTDSVTVSGSVSPASAVVRVDGRAAELEGEAFTAEVPLEPGANVIDVIASARGRAPALTAVRVTRELLVEVPDLDGLTPEEAESRLADAGLKAEIEEDSGFFDELLPGEPAVCDQDPEEGTEVRRGSVVLVTVGKQC